MGSKDPVIHLDDTDIVKPNGRKFEDLYNFRDGSESTATKNIYKNGYHVTEACTIAKNGHPVSIFSKIYSSKEGDFISTNSITFEAMEHGASWFEKATFVIDRGKKQESYLSHVNVKITASRKDIYLVLVYGITEHPMMLATNIFSRPDCKWSLLSHLKFSLFSLIQDLGPNIYIIQGSNWYL